jgi:hypothetical protein
MSEKKNHEPVKEKLRFSTAADSVDERADLVVMPHTSGESSQKVLTGKAQGIEVDGISKDAKDGKAAQLFHAADSEKLARIVGDPHAEEKHWYPAAEAAGDKDLSGAPTMAKVIMFRTAVVLGVVLSFFSIMACYVSSVFFASDVGWLGLNLHNNTFLNDLVGLDYMGWLIAGGGALFFWSSFFKYWTRTIRYVAVALFMGFAFQSIRGHFFLDVLPTVAFSALYLPFLYLLGWVGNATREALPMHIGSKKLASVLLPAVAFPGVAMATTFWIVAQPGYGQPTLYTAGTFGELGINACLILLSSFVPGFVLSRTINAKSPSGAGTLSLLLQTPLLLGLVLTMATCLLLGPVQSAQLANNPIFAFLNGMGGGNWVALGPTKALALLSAAVLACVSAFGGGALGAWCNNHFRDKKDEKPIEMG